MQEITQVKVMKYLFLFRARAWNVIIFTKIKITKEECAWENGEGKDRRREN